MASKAAYGALMGLGQGISGYGQSMMADTLRKEQEQRAYDRQRSLEEIRQKYQQGLIDSARAYDREKLDPNTEIGSLVEEEKQRRLQDSITLQETRNDAWADRGYGVPSISTLSKFTDESVAAARAEVGRLVADGASEREAWNSPEVASILESKPKTSSNAVDAKTAGAQLDLIKTFWKLDRYKKEEKLEGYFPGQDFSGMPEGELDRMYEAYVTGNLPTYGGQGLTNSRPITPNYGPPETDTIDPTNPLGLPKYPSN